MALQQQSNSVLVMTLEPPFPGVVSAVPSNISPPNSFTDAGNFLVRDSRIETRFAMNVQGPPPDANAVLGIAGFEDINNVYHTIILTNSHAYYQTNGLTLPWTYTNITGVPGAGVLPYSFAFSQRKLYFSNGANLPIAYADGSTTLGTTNSPMGANYIAVINSHLCGAYCNEGGSIFPYRVRWSANGVFNNWTDFSSGLADLVETGDDITGLIKLGYYGYVFRSQGITAMIPSGIGTAPFEFEPLTTAPEGLGCTLPYSISVYGNVAAFVGPDDVYTFDAQNFNKIGGKNRRRLMQDLQHTPNNNAEWVIGKITPYFVDASSTTYIGLFYSVSIPGPASSPILWTYSYTDDAWTRIYPSIGGGHVTCIGLPGLDTAGMGHRFCFGAVDTTGAVDIVTALSTGNTETACSLLFPRSSWVIKNKQKVVNQIGFLYEDVGPATLTFTVSSPKQSISKTASFGTATADGLLKRAFVNLGQKISSELLQLQITRNGGTGSVVLCSVEAWLREGGDAFEASV